MLGLFGSNSRKRPSPPAPTPPHRTPPPPQRGTPKPFEIPDPSGRCQLLEMPDEVLTDIFLRLDLTSLTSCYRLNKTLNSFLLDSSAAINLHHTLMANSLQLNPHAVNPRKDGLRHIPLSSADMLSTLRERLTRFRNLKPISVNTFNFRGAEGRLYEYLEGVLLRSATGSTTVDHGYTNQLAVYDLRKTSDWEDVHESDAGAVDEDDGEEIVIEEGPDHVSELLSTQTFKFIIKELAVDPGQDLLVLVEMRLKSSTAQSEAWTMVFHLLSLSTFKPHPLAKRSTISWPLDLSSSRIHLDFQIADDGMFVMDSSRMGSRDVLCGWQWTTGRLHTMLRAPNGETKFSTFLLLSPSSVVVPTMVMSPTEHFTLAFSYHLQLYAFPPLSSINPAKSHDSRQQPFPATHVCTIDLPDFLADGVRIAPPVLTARADPPPRRTFETFPTHSPPPFHPDPTSGVLMFSYYHDMEIFGSPHYVLVTLRSTLAKFLPPPTSPLLFSHFSRPVPVIPWARIAPDVRLFGPDLDTPEWVCYVYQNRYVQTYTDEEGETEVRLLDFDPVRVRKEKLDRHHNLNRPLDQVEGDVDGIVLVTSETVIGADHDSPEAAPQPLLNLPMRTGANLPYIVVSRHTSKTVALLDGERIIMKDSPPLRRTGLPQETDIDVWEF